jgi:polyhydroxybutyrate depolymerase
MCTVYLPLCFALAALTTPAMAGDWGDLEDPQNVPVQMPQGYDGTTPTPMILLLHGYGPVDGEWSDDAVLGFANPSYEKGYLLVRPTGSSNGFNYFWTASEACCDFYGENPDHVGYLLAILDHVQATYNVDPQHVHLVGYSNGGFMVHRMGCEHPDRFASITSISGAGPMNLDNCVATNSLHVLHLHGTEDETILHGGGMLYGVQYPSAAQTAANWATHMGCPSESLVDDTPMDIDEYVTGAETTQTHLTPTCPIAGKVDKWDAFGSEHQFWLGDEAFDRFFNWFAAHGTPSTCTGDLTGDGVVDVADLLDLLAVFGSAEGDLDGDGVTTVSDLLMLLGAWGECS